MREVNVEVELDLAAELAAVEGDSRALNQVFLNLLKNAAEALDGRGGSVCVRAREEKGEIVVRVQDDGPGIAADLRSRLFEPFFSTKESGKGTGLGLAISRRIVMDHGGSIELVSPVGSGAIFEVRLPIQDPTG